MKNFKKYINGCGYPAISIIDVQNRLIDFIELPLCDKNGLIETWDIIKDEYETLNGKIIQFIRGYRGHFDLSYASCIIKDNSLKIQKILQYKKENYRLIFTPRYGDVPWRHFEVVLENDNVVVGILTGGYHSKGNKLVTLKLKTVNIEASPNWVDPDEAPLHVINRPSSCAIMSSNE